SHRSHVAVAGCLTFIKASIAARHDHAGPHQALEDRCMVMVRPVCLAVLALAAVAAPAGAGPLSGRPITIVVPFTPATRPDRLAGLIGDELKARWNVPVVVENKPGATGVIGTQVVARAAPDGNTLLMTSNPFTSSVGLFASVPYDPIKSFAPIIDVGAGALAL